jgi:hypothetical protein
MSSNKPQFEGLSKDRSSNLPKIANCTVKPIVFKIQLDKSKITLDFTIEPEFKGSDIDMGIRSVGVIGYLGPLTVATASVDHLRYPSGVNVDYFKNNDIKNAIFNLDVAKYLSINPNLLPNVNVFSHDRVLIYHPRIGAVSNQSVDLAQPVGLIKTSDSNGKEEEKDQTADVVESMKESSMKDADNTSQTNIDTQWANINPPWISTIKQKKISVKKRKVGE